MRKAAFLLLLSLLAVVVLAQNPADPLPPVPPSSAASPQAGSAYGSAGSMWRRAEIHIVPLDVVAAHRADLTALRLRVEQVKADYAKLNPPDPAVRAQMASQIVLLDSLLDFAERQESDEGKSPTALEVQERLNRIEGRVMCDACHGGLVGEVGSPAAGARSR